MFQSVTVYKFYGDTLELPLKWPNDAGLLISNVEGITPETFRLILRTMLRSMVESIIRPGCKRVI